MAAQEVFQMVGDYAVKVDRLYSEQVRDLGVAVDKLTSSNARVDELLCPLRNHLERLHSMVESEDADQSEQHALFVECCVLMEELNDLSQRYEAYYQSRDGVLLHPIRQLGLRDVEEVVAEVVREGWIHLARFSWCERGDDEHIELDWPHTPDYATVEWQFPELFYCALGDRIILRRGTTRFAWRSKSVFQRRRVPAATSVAALPLGQFKEEYHKLIDGGSSHFGALIRAIQSVLDEETPF